MSTLVPTSSPPKSYLVTMNFAPGAVQLSAGVVPAAVLGKLVTVGATRCWARQIGVVVVMALTAISCR